MVEQLTLVGVALLDEDNVMALLGTIPRSYEWLVVLLIG